MVAMLYRNDFSIDLFIPRHIYVYILDNTSKRTKKLDILNSIATPQFVHRLLEVVMHTDAWMYIASLCRKRGVLNRVEEIYM